MRRNYEEKLSEKIMSENYLLINNTAETDLLKIVPVKILLNFGNYIHTLQLRF